MEDKFLSRLFNNCYKNAEIRSEWLWNFGNKSIKIKLSEAN